MNRKMAIGITHSKDSFDAILNYFVKMNPAFPISLIAVKDRFDTALPKFCDQFFEEVWVIRRKEDIFKFAISETSQSRLRELLPYMYNNSLWKNIALLVALFNQFETLIIWDDDQYLIPLDGSPNWCQPFYETLQLGYDLVEARGYGYQHPIPINISEYVPMEILLALEDVLYICYEAATPHFLTRPEEIFLPYPGVVEEYAVSDRFHTLQFISGGAIGLNLKSQLPLFYQPPGGISRGNDVFFSCAFRSMKKRKLANCFLHDGLTIHNWDPLRKWSTVTATHATREQAAEVFFRVIQGWLSYAPLLLRLEFPQTFSEKLHTIRAKLQQLIRPYDIFYLQFDKYCQRLEIDLERYNRANELWKQLVYGDNGR